MRLRLGNTGWVVNGAVLATLVLSCSPQAFVHAWGGAGERPTGATVVREVRLQITNDEVFVTVVANGKVSYVRQTVSNPPRLIIDMPGTILAERQRQLPVLRGPIKSIRLAQFSAEPPTTRLIVDLDAMIEYEIYHVREGLRMRLYTREVQVNSSPVVSPEVVVLEPTADGEVTGEKVSVRGIAMDAKGIARVQVAGRVAAMQPRSERAMEFWVEDVALRLGENEIEIVAKNVDGVEGRTTIKVRRVEAGPKPATSVGLNLEQVLKLLEAGVTPARMETIVKERGVSFALTQDAEDKLRALGATDSLLLAIAKAKR